MLPGWDSDNQLSLEDNRPSPTFLQPARPSQRGRGRCLLCFRHTFVFTPAVERFEPVFLLCHCPWGQLKLKGHFVIFYVLNNIRVSLVLHDIFSLNSLFSCFSLYTLMILFTILQNRKINAFCTVAGYRYHSRLKRVTGSAACCMRKDRRRLPSKVKVNWYLPLQWKAFLWSLFLTVNL